MIDGFINVQTRRGSYRQPYSFQSTPSLLDRMTVDVGGQTDVLVIVVAVEPVFKAGEAHPSLNVTCEEQEFHRDRRRYG